MGINSVLNMVVLGTSRCIMIGASHNDYNILINGTFFVGVGWIIREVQISLLRFPSHILRRL